MASANHQPLTMKSGNLWLSQIVYDTPACAGDAIVLRKIDSAATPAIPPKSVFETATHIEFLFYVHLCRITPLNVYGLELAKHWFLKPLATNRSIISYAAVGGCGVGGRKVLTFWGWPTILRSLLE